MTKKALVEILEEKNLLSNIKVKKIAAIDEIEINDYELYHIKELTFAEKMPRKEALANALSERFGEPLVVDITIGAAADETPLQGETRRADEKIEAALATLESDPNVKSLKDMFGAELNADSIELINGTQND